MTTKQTDTLPEIEWDRGQKFERHDQVTLFEAIGTGPNNKTYMGVWEETNGQDVDILDIEEL